MAVMCHLIVDGLVNGGDLTILEQPYCLLTFLENKMCYWRWLYVLYLWHTSVVIYTPDKIIFQIFSWFWYYVCELCAIYLYTVLYSCICPYVGLCECWHLICTTAIILPSKYIWKKYIIYILHKGSAYVQHIDLKIPLIDWKRWHFWRSQINIDCHLVQCIRGFCSSPLPIFKLA